MKFEIRHRFNVDIDTYWSKVFFDEEYNRKLFLEGLEFGRFEVLSETGKDGEARTRTVLTEPKADAPAVVRKLVGDSLAYTESGSFDPKTRIWTYNVTPSKLADKIHTSGKFWAEPKGENQIDRVCMVELSVKIFGVGGAVERFIERTTRENYDKAAEFTNRFLAEKGYSLAAMPLLYAHRGAPFERPENTLQSFKLAWSYGIRYLESDVHLTADGELVLSHDATGKRMAGVERPIAQCSLQEVQGWDAGFGFQDAAGERPFAEKGYKIPRLADVLEAFPSGFFNLDAKADCPRLVAAMVDLVEKMGAWERVRIASFHSANLSRVRALGYSGPTGLGPRDLAQLALTPARLAWAFPPKGDAAQIPAHHGLARLDSRRLIGRLQAAGVAVHYWTIDDPAEADRLVRRGADGIMTDNARGLAELFRQRAWL